MFRSSIFVFLFTALVQIVFVANRRFACTEYLFELLKAFQTSVQVLFKTWNIFQRNVS